MPFYRLGKKCYGVAKKNYVQERYRYPIIAAVLDEQQDGKIFANDSRNPTSFFVEHKFGFSQIFGLSDKSFLDSLRRYLFIERQFAPEKIRVYSPEHSKYFNGNAEPSERCQFRLQGKQNINDLSLPNGIQVVDATTENADKINAVFGLDLFNRFWNSKNDFLSQGMGKVILVKNQIISICYAAAVAEGVAEIDIATVPTHRRKGFGYSAGMAFIDGCLKNEITPNWDCFTNNIGSMRLAQSLGFKSYATPYKFFTLRRI